MFVRLALILLSLLLLVSTGCRAERPPTLNIGTNIWVGYEILYFAREKGFLPPSRLRLIEYPSASEVIRAFRNGSIQAAALTLDEVLQLADMDFDPVIILVFNISNGADGIVARNGIEHVRELRGRRIAVEQGALGAYVLSRALDSGMLREDQIEILPVEVSDHEAFFLSEDVDAIVTFEPIITRLTSAGAGRLIFDSSHIPDEIIDALVVDRSFASNHPEVVFELLVAWRSATKYAEENQLEMLQSYTRRLDLSVEDVESVLLRIDIPGKATNSYLLQPNGVVVHSLSRLQSRMLQRGLLRNGVAVERLVDTQFLEMRE